jgi:hypothetical protein
MIGEPPNDVCSVEIEAALGGAAAAGADRRIDRINRTLGAGIVPEMRTSSS